MESTEIEKLPEYQATMQRLEAVKRKTDTGKDYWHARDIHDILGYPTWAKFEDVIARAMTACAVAKLPVENHFARTGKMVELGSGGHRELVDHYLSRAGCYFVAMNGDPSKPEIAAAQAYFAIQTRRMEIADEMAAQQQQLDADRKRLEMRNKVSASFKKISAVAQDAGVERQGIFHDARYRGLYGMPLRDVKRKKGVGDKENLLDRAGALELSANDFQMLMAADIIATNGIRGEAAATALNERVGKKSPRNDAKRRRDFAGEPAD
jgi:DNA-damage-inducible protein D